MLAAIRQWVIKTMMKGQTGVVQSLPKREIIEMNTQITAERIMRNGINPNDLKTVGQVENVVNQIDQPKVISADSAEGKGITEKLLGKKKADVMDMEGNKIPEGSKIMGGKQIQPINMTVEERTGGLLKGKYESDEAIKTRLVADNKKGIAGIKNNRMLDEDEIAQLDEDIGGLEYTNDFDGTVGSANKLRKERADYIADMELEYKKGNLDPEPGSGTSQRKRFLQKKLEEAESSGDARLISREEREELFDLDDIPEYADGGRIGYFMGSAYPKGAAALREMLKFFGKKSDSVKNPSDILRIVNSKQFNKTLEDPSIYRKFDVEKGIGAPDMIRNIQKKMTSDRQSTVKEMLSAAKNIKKSDDATLKYKNEMIEEMMNKGADRKMAEEMAETISKIAENAAGKSNTPKLTDEGILQLENILKNMETGGKKPRDLNADGGRIGLKGGGQDASKSDFKSTNTNSPGHPSNRTTSPSTNKATVGGGGGGGGSKPPPVIRRTGDGGITDIKLKKPTRLNEPNTTKFQKFLNFLGKETGYTQHNIDNQKLRNALDDEEITEEQYKRMGGFDVAKNMPQGLGLGYGDVGLASAGYNAIKSIGNLFNAPGSEYGDIGPLESIKLNTQGAAGLGKKDQMMYDDIVGGKKFFSNENEMYNMADGGRIGYKAGSVDKMRRLILKAMGAGTVGIGAAKSGIFSFGKGATKQVAKEVAQQTTSSMPPPYFFKLAEKIKKMGDDVSAKAATKDREVVTKFKEYELTEDISTGEMTIQRMKVTDPESASYYGQALTEETYMSYKPGETIIGKGNKPVKTGPEYEEGTAHIRSDGMNAGEIVDDMPGVSDDILEEVGEAKSIKYASGGLAYMLGE